MSGGYRWIFYGLIFVLAIVELTVLFLSHGSEVDEPELPQEAPGIGVAGIPSEKPVAAKDVPVPTDANQPDLSWPTPMPGIRQPGDGSIRIADIRDGKPTLPEGDCTVSGVVVDANGTPLAGMKVISGGMAGANFPRTETDSQGRFHADRLLPQEYELMAIPPTTTGRSIDTGKVEILLKEGQNLSGIRIIYEGASERSIAGRVTDAAGKPMEGVSISGNDYARALYVTTKSSADGRYVLDVTLGARCQVSARHQDYSFQAEKQASAGDHDVNFVLTRRGAIEGRVMDARTREPVTTFEVGARLHSQRISRISYEQFENVDGLFRLEQVSSGELNVYVRAEGYAPCRVESVIVRPDDVTGGVTARLNHGASLQGRVVSMGGAPVEGAKFRLQNPDDWAMLPPVESEGDDTITVRSGADGRFAIDQLDPGFREITAVHADYPETKVPLNLAVGKATTMEIVMTGLATVEGTVYLNGQPVEGQQVSISNGSVKPSRDGETDHNGFYRVGDVPGGEVTVNAFVNAGIGTRIAKARATTKPGYTTTVDLEVVSGTATIEGIITRDGEPLESMSVSARTPNGDDQAATMTSVDGGYRIAGLFGGTYRISVIDTNREPFDFLGSAEATVEAGESTVLDIDVNEP